MPAPTCRLCGEPITEAPGAHLSELCGPCSIPEAQANEILLSAEYEQWLAEQGIDDTAGSADDLVLDESLSLLQRQWLTRFIIRWNRDVYGRDA